MLPTVKVLDVSLRATRWHFNGHGRLNWERSRRREIRENVLVAVEGPRRDGGGDRGGLEPGSDQMKSIILKSQLKKQ